MFHITSLIVACLREFDLKECGMWYYSLRCGIAGGDAYGSIFNVHPLPPVCLLVSLHVVVVTVNVCLYNKLMLSTRPY